MVEIREEIEIDAPAETVWQRLSDLGAIQEWAAPIAKSECEGAPGPGAVRRCEFAEGGAIEERITDWSENEGLAYQIASENPVFDGAQTVWRLDEGDARTRVTYEMDVDPPGDAADEAGAELAGTARFLLQSLKHNLETGGVLEPPEP